MTNYMSISQGVLLNFKRKSAEQDSIQLKTNPFNLSVLINFGLNISDDATYVE
jgi:hypothetical protein